MGQYYLIVNIDKKEYIHPHKFDDGMKLCEFGGSGEGTMFALSALLADGNGRGGGDIHKENILIGSWAGNRIVIAGDYADEGKFMTKKEIKELEKEKNLYDLTLEKYKDISQEILEVIKNA